MHPKNNAEDEALLSANAALRDVTRFSRLLTALNEPASIEPYLDRILSTISELFLADIVILLNPAGKGDFMPVASLGLPEGLDAQLFAHSSVARAFDALRVGTIFDPSTHHRDPMLDAGLRSLGIESGAWIPMAGSAESRGAILLARCKPIPFSREEIDLLSAMAYRIGLALEQIEQKTQLELLASGIRQIVMRPDEASIEESAVGLFAHIMKADAAILLGPTSDGDSTCVRASSGFGAGGREPVALALSAGTNAPGDVNGVRCSVEGGATGAIADSLGFPCKSVLSALIPLAGGSGKWLLALRCNSIAFGEGSRQIAALYARQIGSLLENARLYGELKQELAERMRAEAALKENEAILRTRQAELQRTVEARDRLVSIIGHDLRGPVGSMCNLLRFVMEDPRESASEDRAYILAEVLQAGESIQGLLLNLLDWGKTQASAIALRPQRLQLRLCVEEVLALLCGLAVTKGVELLDEVGIEALLIADQDSLQTILRNLVSNAIKYTDSGGRVTIGARIEGAAILIRIADTGVGMDEATRTAALDFSARRSTRGTRGEKGVGLGLVLCKDLAEKNGGSIFIESVQGKGTEVTLALMAGGESLARDDRSQSPGSNPSQ
jgi:signal transduction histidine kinase